MTNNVRFGYIMPFSFFETETFTSFPPQLSVKKKTTSKVIIINILVSKKPIFLHLLPLCSAEKKINDHYNECFY